MLTVDVNDEASRKGLFVVDVSLEGVVGTDEIVPNTRLQIFKAMRKTLQKIVHLVRLIYCIERKGKMV